MHLASVVGCLYVSFFFKKCVKYWLKLIMMEDNRYPKQCYMMLYRLDQAERKTWATHVRTLLYKFGFGYAWISQEVGNTVNTKLA